MNKEELLDKILFILFKFLSILGGLTVSIAFVSIPIVAGIKLNNYWMLLMELFIIPSLLVVFILLHQKK